MGEYEPTDSRDVTQSDHQAPGEPPRTGPREDAARERAEQGEADDAATNDATDGREPNAELARKDAEDARRARSDDQQDEDFRHKL